jgi:hypothetical protein
MKKILATAAAAVLAAATLSAGEGLKVSGFVRGGLSADITDSVAEGSHFDNNNSVIGTTWVGGDHWGGVSRARFNALYDGDMGGVDFRFQPNLTSDYFTNKNVKWAMAYAKFFDGAIEVEGGKLHDRYTGADDDYGQVWNSVMGARLVIHPVDSLYITFMGSDKNPDYYDYTGENLDPVKDAKKIRRWGNPKFDKNLFSATARFENDAFAIVGGAHFSGLFYGSFSLKAIENLTFTAGFYADYAKHYSKSKTGYDKDGNASTDEKKIKYYTYNESDNDSTHYLLTDVNLEYNADPVTFGVVGYLYIAETEWYQNEDNDEENPWLSKITPYVEYKLSDVVALRAESTLFLPVQWDEDKYGERMDMYTTVTPSVVFNASKKADVNVWLTISSDTDYQHHSTGVGVKYAF